MDIIGRFFVDSDLETESSSEEDISSDEELEIREKNEDYLETTVPTYTDEVFFEHFRVSRGVANNIAESYRNSAYYTDKSGTYGKISPLHQVLIFLWFIGHQAASYRDVGDRFNVTISSVHRVITKVTYFLSNRTGIIKWPNEERRMEIEQHFRRNGFPNVMGVIDGCHVEIDRPDNDPDSYINRKSYYSIQMQAVCDHKRRFTDVFIGFPGSVHDSRVFRNSTLGRNLAGMCGEFHLLGDSGYPLKRNLLVPFRDRGNLSPQESRYNRTLSRNRYIIEHTFGILKQKFRQLYHIKLRDIRLIVHLIRAACVLHNIAIDDDYMDHGEQFGVVDQGVEEREEEEEVEENDAREYRRIIANTI